MPPDLKRLPPAAARRLREYYRRKRFYAFMRVILSAGSVYLLLALIVMHLDRFLFMETATRVLLSTIVHAAGSLYALVLTILFVARRVSTRRLAYELESRLPRDVSERYVTLATLDTTDPDGSRGEVHRSLVDQLVRETITFSESFFGGRLVLDRRFRLLGAVTVALLGLYALLLIPPAYQFDLMLQRFAMPRANLPKPSFVTLEVTPESAVIGRGGEIVIQAHTEGAIPDMLAWLYRWAGIMPGDCMLTVIPEATDQPTRTVPMSRIQRALFIHSATELRESFTFRVRAADAETALHHVEVVVQPAITGTSLTLTPPAYTRLPTATLTNVQESVSIYPGTQVELEFTVDQAVTELGITLPRDRTERPDWDPDTRTGSYAFDFAEPFDMEITVVNARGFANTVPVRIPFRALEDQRPTVRLEYPTGDLAAVPGELIPIQFRVEDDLGVEEVYVQYILNPDDDIGLAPRELAVEFDDEADTRALDLSYLFDLDTTGAVPGDQLLFLIRARDGGGNDGESRPVTVTLTAFARGENERRRLEVLAFIDNALRRMGDAADAEAAATESREQAGEQDIPLEPGTLHAALLRLMEQEHHFTDHPLHKADMQRLAGLVRAAKSGNAAAPDGAALQRAARHIPELTAARRLQNAIWGYFGLTYELASILDRMTQTEAQRRERAVSVEALLTDHARALAKAAREDATVRELVAELREQEGALDAAREAAQRERETLEAELPPGMGMAYQPDSPELRRLTTAVSDQLQSVAAAKRDIQARGHSLGQSLLSRDERQLLDRHVDASVVRAIRASIAFEAATDRDLPIDPLVQETVRTQLPALPPPAGEMQSINRRARLFLRSAENTGAALAGLPWDPDFEAESLRTLQSDLNAAIHRITRTGESLSLRVAAGRDIHDRIMAITALLAAQAPPLSTRETLARATLEQAFHGVRRRLQGDQLARWLLADLTIQSFNPFADLAPSLRGFALLDSIPSGTSSFLEALDEQVPGAAPVVTGQGYLLALDYAFQSLRDNPRVAAPERDLAFRFMALESALFFGAVSPTNATSRWHTAVAAFNPDDPATAPDAIETLLTGIDAIGATPAPIMRELLTRHVVPDPRGALRAILRHWRTSEAMFETTQAAIGADNDSLSQPFARLLEVIQADVDALEAFGLRLQLRLAWLPDGPQRSAEHALMLRLRETLGRFQARSARGIATLDDFTRRPMTAADATEALTAVRGLDNTVQVLRNAVESLLDESEPVDASRYPLLATFEETALLRELAAAALAGDDPAAIAQRYLDAFPQAAGYFIADQRDRLVAATRHVEQALELLEAEPVDPAAIDVALDTAVAEADAFVAALAAVDTEEAVRLQADAGELRNRVGAQRFAGDVPETGAVRQRLFVLTETRGQLARLATRIADGPDGATTPATVYSGGPDNIWTRDNRMHAEYARNRLNAQAGHADRRISIGLLAALQPDVNAPRARRAAADWSAFLYRLVRSPLTGPVRTVTVAQPTRDAVDPLTEWLMRQLDDARKEAAREGNLREYRAQTLEWIDSLRDFLRY